MTIDDSEIKRPLQCPYLFEVLFVDTGCFYWNCNAETSVVLVAKLISNSLIVIPIGFDHVLTDLWLKRQVYTRQFEVLFLGKHLWLFVRCVCDAWKGDTMRNSTLMKVPCNFLKPCVKPVNPLLASVVDYSQFHSVRRFAPNRPIEKS